MKTQEEAAKIRESHHLSRALILIWRKVHSGTPIENPSSQIPAKKLKIQKKMSRVRRFTT
jgi:hypothetical protein